MTEPGPSRTAWITEHSTLVLTLAVLATGALAVPFLLLPPSETASQEPGGPVFAARDRADRRFATAVHRFVFVVEAKEGDLLRRAPLLELKRNLDALRRHPELGQKLFSYQDPLSGQRVTGGVSIADAVDGVLRAQGVGGLGAASAAQVSAAVGLLLSSRSPTMLGLAAQTRQEQGRWRSPAATVAVLADNDALGGGGASTTLGSGSLEKERFGRRVQQVLRGDQRQIRVWGLAMDVNLTSAEQGRAAGPYIGFTILAVLVLVGLTYRSYWAVAVAGFALGALIVWLKGLSNLIGLKNDQILSIIVPIAMISFGVDFAFHAVGRYREQLSRPGVTPRRALTAGLSGVMGALVLALASDAAAFLANATSSIESLVQFGVGAALALCGAFVMLGVVTPVALMRIEERVGSGPRRSTVVRLLGPLASLLAAAAAMAAVTVSVFVKPWLGVAMLGGHLLLFVLVPAVVAARIARGSASAEQTAPGPGLLAAPTGQLVAWLARRRWPLLGAVAVVTTIAAVYASRVGVSFDVKDFFAADTDFVVGLEKFQKYVGEQGGEPAFVYVETDLTRPEAVLALRRFVDELRRLRTRRLARDAGGSVRVDTGVLEVIRSVMTRPDVRMAVAAETGNPITDGDGDGVPDTHEQLAGLYRFARQRGVPAGEGRGLLMQPEKVQAVLWQPSGGGLLATRVGVWLPGSASQDNIRQAQRQLRPLLDRLLERLLPLAPRSWVVLTGRPIVRQASLDAIFRSFLLSLPVAVVLCLIIAALFMRSLRFGAVSTVPILLVVVWLYAFMYLFGFAINVVTATIGAISIGIGIDYAVHFTMRYREELGRNASRLEALRASGAGTGVALLASALSSVVGFVILAFAPMPMFAAYGLLTAVMILMAAVASLMVLPALLMLVTRDPGLAQLRS